jgi:hypothetical protein
MELIEQLRMHYAANLSKLTTTLVRSQLKAKPATLLASIEPLLI